MSSHLVRSLAWLILVSAGLLPASLHGQHVTEYATVDLAKVDGDFPYQGEFWGQIWGDLEHKTGLNVALQVVAKGDCQFDGKLFFGGFPGYGWNGLAPTVLSGTRVDNVLEMRGDGYIFVVTDRYADVYFENYIPLGQIAKIVRVSPTFDMLPPWSAKTLFNGYDAEQFVGGRISRDGWLMQGTEFKERFQDYTLHIEFMLPYMPRARGQSRGNSGVYLQSRYEVQILDSFGLEGAENECGALYKFKRPDANMCYPPLTWQTYDIVFNSPRFAADGSKLSNAHITVYQNGVAVHHNVDLFRKTGGGAQEGPDLLPIKLQDHDSPVRFRNIWIIDDAAPNIDPYPHYARPEGPFRPWGIDLAPGYAPIQRGYPPGVMPTF
jgi:hypothetical protein